MGWRAAASAELPSVSGGSGKEGQPHGRGLQQTDGHGSIEREGWSVGAALSCSCWARAVVGRRRPAGCEEAGCNWPLAADRADCRSISDCSGLPRCSHPAAPARWWQAKLAPHPCSVAALARRRVISAAGLQPLCSAAAAAAAGPPDAPPPSPPLLHPQPWRALAPRSPPSSPLRRGPGAVLHRCWPTSPTGRSWPSSRRREFCFPSSPLLSAWPTLR